MTAIYEVSYDSAHCRSLSISDEGYLRNMFFDGTARIADWTPPLFWIYDPLMPDSDFVSAAGSAPTLHERLMTNERLKSIFVKCGELLPIRTETGERYLILNVTAVHNVLDIECCQFGKTWNSLTKTVNEKGRLEKYAFQPRNIPVSQLFKVPETARAHVLTSRNTRHRPPEEDFMSIYEREGLTGLKFEKVWEGPSEP